MATPRWLTATAALILPVGVIVGALHALTRPVPFELSKAAVQLEATLAEEQPQLVLVGNSLLGQGVNVEALSKAMDVPAISTLWGGATRPANWYAMLRNRLFANGHTPHAIVIVTTPEMLMDVDTIPQVAMDALTEQLGEYEPVINKKVFGSESDGSLFTQRLHASRAAAQEAARLRVRDATVGLLFGGEGPVLERGGALAERAMAAVFGGEDAVDMSLHHRVIPVMQSEVEQTKTRRKILKAADTFVPDLIALAEENEARLVFVWIPLSPDKNEAAQPAPDVMADLLSVINDSGAGWIDLHDLGLDWRMFKDSVHLNLAGRDAFTEVLAEALSDAGVMGDAPFADARLPVVLERSVSRVGAPPPPRAIAADALTEKGCLLRTREPQLSAIGMQSLSSERLGSISPVVVTRNGEPLIRSSNRKKVEGTCDAGIFQHRNVEIIISRDTSGDDATYALALDEALPVVMEGDEGWWIYPGTELRFDFEDRTNVGAVWLSVHPFGEGEVSATVAGQPMALAPERRWLSGEARPSGDGPWSVVITSPKDGPFAAVRRLSVSKEDQVIDIVGDTSRLAPAAVGFLSHTWSEENLLHSEPLTLQPLNATFKRRLGSADVADLQGLSNAAIAARLPCTSCSPLVVMEGDVPLRRGFSSCARLLSEGDRSNYCFEGELAQFIPSNGKQPPAELQQSYSAALKERRRTPYGWWIYPGDTQRYRLSPHGVRTLLDGGRVLTLEGAMFEADPGDEVSLTLRSVDEVLATFTLAASELEDNVATFALDPPVTHKTPRVTVEITSAADGPYVLLGTLSISESP